MTFSIGWPPGYESAETIHPKEKSRAPIGRKGVDAHAQPDNSKFRFRSGSYASKAYAVLLETGRPMVCHELAAALGIEVRQLRSNMGSPIAAGVIKYRRLGTKNGPGEYRL